MKKILGLLSIVCLLFGCSSYHYDYEGSYTLINNGNHTSLVTYWVYPSDDMTVDTHEINTNNLNDYIDENFDNSGEGLSLNLLLGCLGYERKFFSIEPIKISNDDINKIMKKNIQIEMDVVDKNGNSYKVGLKFDKELKKNYEENMYLLD